ncbi:MAG TPA: hypothetical protein VHX36_04765 [Candidatus Acidoferrales bacterium]|jgi:hypothetical protein|nr:hypothetical protein [Candidatus Acidoferrales bacterium]
MSFRVTNRQVGWAVFVALAGSFVGGEVGLATGIIIGGAWGGAIGYGIGLILDQKLPRQRILIHWAATLALFCPLPSIAFAAVPRPNISTGGLVLAGSIGAIAGVVLGLLGGALHARRLRWKMGPTS